MQKNKGILVVVSGFSGAGKGTIMRELMQTHSEQYALSISATTQGASDCGETDGIEYFFKSWDDFEQMIAEANWSSMHSMSAIITERRALMWRNSLRRARMLFWKSRFRVR